VSAGSYRLELGGQSLSVNAIEGGGTVGVVISGPPTGGSPFREKHLAGMRYELIAIAASFGSARPLFDLVRSATSRHRPHCRLRGPRRPCPYHRISGSISLASTAPKSPRLIRSR